MKFKKCTETKLKIVQKISKTKYQKHSRKNETGRRDKGTYVNEECTLGSDSSSHRPIWWKDMIGEYHVLSGVNGVGNGVLTDVTFIYSICFKHFLIDLGC